MFQDFTCFFIYTKKRVFDFPYFCCESFFDLLFNLIFHLKQLPTVDLITLCFYLLYISFVCLVNSIASWSVHGLDSNSLLECGSASLQLTFNYISSVYKYCISSSAQSESACDVAQGTSSNSTVDLHIPQGKLLYLTSR